MSPGRLCPWLFCQPVLKLKRLKMYMSNAVHVHTDIQVEQVEIAPNTSHVTSGLRSWLSPTLFSNGLSCQWYVLGYMEIYSWSPLCTELLPLPAQLTRKSIGGVADRIWRICLSICLLCWGFLYPCPRSFPG